VIKYLQALGLLAIIALLGILGIYLRSVLFGADFRKWSKYYLVFCAVGAVIFFIVLIVKKV